MRMYGRTAGEIPAPALEELDTSTEPSTSAGCSSQLGVDRRVDVHVPVPIIG